MSNSTTSNIILEFSNSNHPSLILLLLIAFILLTIFYVTINDKQTWSLLPPGPTPWPIIGNLHELRRNKPPFRWILSLFEKHQTEILCIRLANTHVIPVMSPELGLEFLKHHDSIFSSRPITMASSYGSRGFLTIAQVPFGDQWRKMRKIVTSEVLTASNFRLWLDKRNQEADHIVKFIHNNSINSSVIDLRLVCRHYSGNVSRRLMFSTRYFGKGAEDGGPGFEEEEVVDSLWTVILHLYSFCLSDYTPFLRVFDLEGHEKNVREAMRIVNKYHDQMVDQRMEQWRQGKRAEAEDMLDALILAKDAKGEPALSVEEIKAQCTEILLASTDNTSNAIEWAMAEMLNQPELLQRATEEIDIVVGKDRWVQESDLPQLNYVKACAREAFRLHPVAPFNMPHVSLTDAVVAGYFIPKGSHVLISRVGIGRNPRVWEEPLKFKPERHLKDGVDVELPDPQCKIISFSMGRRGCMAVTLGSALTGMLLARLLQGFTWTVPPNQENIDLSEEEDSLLLTKPLLAHATPRLSSTMYLEHLL